MTARAETRYGGPVFDLDIDYELFGKKEDIEWQRYVQKLFQDAGFSRDLCNQIIEAHNVKEYEKAVIRHGERSIREALSEGKTLYTHEDLEHREAKTAKERRQELNESERSRTSGRNENENIIIVNRRLDENANAGPRILPRRSSESPPRMQRRRRSPSPETIQRSSSPSERQGKPRNKGVDDGQIRYEVELPAPLKEREAKIQYTVERKEGPDQDDKATEAMDKILRQQAGFHFRQAQDLLKLRSRFSRLKLLSWTLTTKSTPRKNFVHTDAGESSDEEEG